METGWRYPERRKHLQDLQGTQPENKRKIYFQGQQLLLPEYRVPIGLPKYRLNNGRTYAAQAEYLAANPEQPEDFFTTDVESDAALQVQHDLLKGLIELEDLLKHFRKHEQNEPLILTFEGFVLNGNRRLCAFRELLAEDPDKYERFNHIDVVVLPKANERDLDELEARFQIHRDLRADYSWVTFALMLRRRKKEHGYSEKQLARLYEKKKKEIVEHLGCLADAEAYLKFIGSPAAYHLVERDRYAFEQLAKSRKKLTGNADRELLERISYAYIENPSSGRAYSVIPKLAESIGKIQQALVDALEIVPERRFEDDDAIDLLDGDSSSAMDVTTLLESLEDPSHRKTAVEMATFVVEEEALRKREKQRRTYVLDRLRSANSALAEATNAVGEDTRREGIAEQLDAIDLYSAKLREWLDEHS